MAYPNKTHYSRHFSRAELDCRCGAHGPGSKKHNLIIRRRLRRLAINLERLRALHGEGIGITSGYRCKAHNRNVGGAVKSQHLTGLAADIAVPGRTKSEKLANQAKLVSAAEKVRAFRRGGIGTYPNGGLHVDMRGTVARWTSFVGQ